MKKDLVLSCHDISEGGLAVAAVEMAFGGNIGAELVIPADVNDIPAFLFNEAPARFVVEIAPSKKNEFEQSFEAGTVLPLGTVAKKNVFTVRQDSVQKDKKALIEEDVLKLKALWKAPLETL
jgi:phosphoribosylformylglycinamidine synthase